MSTKEELLAAAEVNLERHDGLLGELIEIAVATLEKREPVEEVRELIEGWAANDKNRFLKAVYQIQYSYGWGQLSPYQACVLTGFTGIMFGKFSDFHADAEKRLGRPVWTHEFASPALTAELKELYRQDFMALQPEV